MCMFEYLYEILTQKIKSKHKRKLLKKINRF